ncbi:hypothetical protein CLOM_g22273, partial [Closterium sp. NIES-68]
LGGSAFPQHTALAAHDQLLLRRDGQQQQYSHQQHRQQHQQQQQQHHHPEQQAGVGSLGSASPARTFGGLSFDECRSVFLSPNARRPTAQASLATAFCAAAAAASDAAALSTATAAPLAATPTAAAAVFSVASFPDPALVSSAGSFNAAFPNASAACKLPMKRTREDYGGLLADPSLSGLAGSGWASRTLHHSQSLEDLFLQQEGERSEVQAALWARVVSESALPDDVLLGFSSEDPGVSVPFAALPAPLPAPFSAQPPQAAALPAPLPTQLAAPTGVVPREIRSCLGGTLSIENDSAGQEMLAFMGACSTVPEIDPLFLDTHVAYPCLHGAASRACMGLHVGNPCLFLDSAVAHLCLPTPASYLLTEAREASEASEQQGRPLAGCLPEPTLPEWALEQGGTGEKGGQEHRHQHPVGQGVGVEGVSLPQRRHQQQLNGHQHVELERIPSMSSHHQPLPEPHPQPLSEPLPLEQTLALAPSQALEQALALASSQALEQALGLTVTGFGTGFCTGTVAGSWSNQF